MMETFGKSCHSNCLTSWLAVFFFYFKTSASDVFIHGTHKQVSVLANIVLKNLFNFPLNEIVTKSCGGKPS